MKPCNSRAELAEVQLGVVMRVLLAAHFLLVLGFCLGRKLIPLRGTESNSTADRIEFEPINTEKLLVQKGFKSTKHIVLTDDGYILDLHRAEKPKDNRPPVLLLHGITVASDYWLSQKDDIVSFLYKRGFDVWLGDARGNCYSRLHSKYRTKSKEYWNFTFHEIGIYDVPAMIDRILEVTGQEKLFFVGHSMGGTDFAVTMSMRPEYNDKIKLAFLLASAFWTSPLERVPSQWRIYITHHRALHKLAMSRGMYEIFPRVPAFSEMTFNACHDSNLQDLCLLMLDNIFGAHRNNYSPEAFDALSQTIPSGTSTKAMEHLMQTMTTRRFQQYDYGEKENLVKYGSRQPPFYNMSLISAPVAYYYGTNDLLIPTKSSIETAKRFKNLVSLYAIPDPKFNHIDFLFGKNAKELVYEPMYRLMQKYLVR